MRHTEVRTTLTDGRRVVLEVGYTVSGRHVPATHWQPAEGPDVEVEEEGIIAILDGNGDEVDRFDEPIALDPSLLDTAARNAIYDAVYDADMSEEPDNFDPRDYPDRSDA